MRQPDINNRYLVDTKTGVIRFTPRGTAAWRARFRAVGININTIRTVNQLQAAIMEATVLPYAQLSTTDKLALKQAIVGEPLGKLHGG